MVERLATARGEGFRSALFDIMTGAPSGDILMDFPGHDEGGWAFQDHDRTPENKAKDEKFSALNEAKERFTGSIVDYIVNEGFDPKRIKSDASINKAKHDLVAVVGKIHGIDEHAASVKVAKYFLTALDTYEKIVDDFDQYLKRLPEPSADRSPHRR